jgi:hypothetical protein
MKYSYLLLIGIVIFITRRATNRNISTPAYSPKPTSSSSIKSSASAETVYERNQKDIEHID